MVSLTECSSAILNKALQGGVNLWQLRGKHSFNFQSEDMVIKKLMDYVLIVCQNTFIFCNRLKIMGGSQNDPPFFP